MKRKNDSDDKDSNKKQKIEVFENYPTDVIKEIFAHLTLEDLGVSFVSKSWHVAARIAFKEFYFFQDNYHESKKRFSLDKSPKSAFAMLRKLREVEAPFKNSSKKEITALAKAFLTRNFDSIIATTNTPSWLREIEINKYPERLVQMALLRIWDTVLPISDSPFEDYDRPHLKMLAPSESLGDFFNAENDFATKCDLASELCERGDVPVLRVVYEARNYIAQKEWQKMVELYEIALNKAPDSLLSLDYLYAAAGYFYPANYQRAAELYEIAMLKDPNIEASTYASAGDVNLQIGNYQRAAELLELAISKDQQPNVYKLAAKAYLQLENHQRANELFSIASQIESGQ